MLAAIQEAQEMDGTLVETMSSEASGLDHARSLNTLSNHLREGGRRQEALVVTHNPEKVDEDFRLVYSGPWEDFDQPLCLAEGRTKRWL